MQPCQFRFLTNHCQARCKPEKTTRKTRVRIRGVFGRVEKRFPGPEKFTRKEPRKVFGPEKFSGLLRNARLVFSIRPDPIRSDPIQACVSQKTRKLLGPGNRPAKLPKRLSGVSQSTRKLLTPKNTSFFPVNFTGTRYLPKSVFGSVVLVLA